MFHRICTLGHTSRRGFLRAAALAAAAAGRSQWTSAGEQQKDRSTSTADEAANKVLSRLKGPMAAITVPFRNDFSLDHDSLRAWVDFMCASHVPVLFQTYGDGELYSLNEREVEAVIRTVARQARGRSLVIGGTPHGWTGQTADFINRLEDGGVDALNVHLPYQNEEEIFRAFAQLTEKTRLPLLAYESKWSTGLVQRIAQLPRVVGMKCHAELYGYYDFIRATRDRPFGVLSAGQMKHFLFGYQIGSPAYLCPLTPFAPQIGLKFYEAMVQGRLADARQVIYDYEEPLLKVTIPLGYPQAYKSALHLTGHYSTNLVRPPKATNAAEQLAELREFLMQKGLM